VTALLILGFTQGAVRWFEYQYWMTDPAAAFLLMLAVYWIRRGHTVAFHVLSVVAAFVRETYVVVYPFYLLNLLRRGRSLPDGRPPHRGSRARALRDPDRFCAS